METDVQKERQGVLREAIMWYALEQYDAMLRVCDRALEREQRDGRAHHARALALLGVGRYEEAVGSLDCAFALTQGAPRYYRAWILAEKARALHALGRSVEALRVYEQATTLSPNDRTIQAEKEEEAAYVGVLTYVERQNHHGWARTVSFQQVQRATHTNS